MSAILERILRDLDQLPPHEQRELTAFLNHRFETEAGGQDAESPDVWESEIIDRVAKVRDGTATLTPGDQFQAEMAFFMKEITEGRTPDAL
jgi:hypothetical protein